MLPTDNKTNLIYGIDDRPPPAQMAVLGLQHVLVMFTAMVGSPLAVSRTLGLSPAQTGTMVAGCMLGCGVGTLLTAIGLGPIGGRLPLVLGIFSIFIAPTIAIGHDAGLPSVAGAFLIGSLVTCFASPLLGKVRALLPEVVLGAILLVTGASLLRIAVGLLLQGPGTGIALGGLTLLLIVVLSACGGIFRITAVFFGFLAAYAIAAGTGMIDFGALREARLLEMPALLPFGIAWPSPFAAFVVLICFAAAAVETAVQAVAVARACGVTADASRVRGAVASDGIGSVISALFGGMPLTSYSQNIGAITLTGVGSRAVIATCGAILVALAFMPGISRAISLTPAPVIGGALLFMFGVIATLGIELLGGLQQPRDRTIVAVSISLGLGAAFMTPTQIAMLPPAIQAFLSQGIVVGTISAVIANALLPADRGRADPGPGTAALQSSADGKDDGRP